MEALLQRRDQIDAIVIETSGLALPKPLIQAFRWPEIRTHATVDGVITVADCAAIASGQLATDIHSLETQRQADPSLDHETPLEELFEDQLNCADLVLLTKTDLVTAEQSADVHQWLQTAAPEGTRIVSCDRGRIHPDLLLGFNAAVEDVLDTRPSHHDHGADHEHDDAINAIPVTLDCAFDPSVLVRRLQALSQNQEIYRIKGFVNVGNKPMRLVLQGVGQRFETFYDRPWQPGEARRTQLVFIGNDLSAAAVQSALMN